MHFLFLGFYIDFQILIFTFFEGHFLSALYVKRCKKTISVQSILLKKKTLFNKVYVWKKYSCVNSLNKRIWIDCNNFIVKLSQFFMANFGSWNILVTIWRRVRRGSLGLTVTNDQPCQLTLKEKIAYLATTVLNSAPFDCVKLDRLPKNSLFKLVIKITLLYNGIGKVASKRFLVLCWANFNLTVLRFRIEMGRYICIYIYINVYIYILLRFHDYVLTNISLLLLNFWKRTGCLFRLPDLIC